MTVRPPRRAVRLRRGASVALLAVVAACGPKGLTVDENPFPAPRPVFVDGSGKALADLPAGPETITLLVLDYPWCPACGAAWQAVAEASARLPGAPVRVVRILFDRERAIGPGAAPDVPPLVPAPPPPASLRYPVTTLVALPEAFGAAFRTGDVPLIVLLDARGKVTRRFRGASTGLSDALVAEITLRSAPPPPPPAPET